MKDHHTLGTYIRMTLASQKSSNFCLSWITCLCMQCTQNLDQKTVFECNAGSEVFIGRATRLCRNKTRVSREPQGSSPNNYLLKVVGERLVFDWWNREVGYSNKITHRSKVLSQVGIFNKRFQLWYFWQVSTGSLKLYGVNRQGSINVWTWFYLQGSILHPSWATWIKPHNILFYSPAPRKSSDIVSCASLFSPTASKDITTAYSRIQCNQPT